DANRDDLCLSYADFEVKAERHRPRACVLVHIGGHLAFETERIAAYCRENGIFLLEDCAHAHGADWHGRRPGTFGDAGVYSLYATKTISTGEGGVLVSRHPELLAHARAFRDYGKPDHLVEGLNFRMSEFTAALGLVQIERLDEIVAWKNQVARTRLDRQYPGRLELPDGMTAGVGEVAAAPAEAEMLNARGTLNVLDAARELDVARVVYASTIWVYSDVGLDAVDEATPLLPPSHDYSATTLAGELYCRSYGQL